MNSKYFINNDLTDSASNICTEMDGLTTVFTATAKVNAGQINHMKLAIADKGDSQCDSNVFIKAATLSLPQLTLIPISTSSSDCKLAHSLTSTLVDPTSTTLTGVLVTFIVISGPNAGQSGTAITDLNGVATWAYSGIGTTGTDTIVATASTLTSNNAYIEWNCGVSPVPEFPTVALPVALIVGLVFVLYTFMFRKEE